MKSGNTKKNSALEWTVQDVLSWSLNHVLRLLLVCWTRLVVPFIVFLSLSLQLALWCLTIFCICLTMTLMWTSNTLQKWTMTLSLKNLILTPKKKKAKNARTT